MRAFQVTWFAFFLAFFGWFGIVPIVAVVREDLDLTRGHVGDTVIASIAANIVVRLSSGGLPGPSGRVERMRAYSCPELSR